MIFYIIACPKLIRPSFLRYIKMSITTLLFMSPSLHAFSIDHVDNKARVVLEKLEGDPYSDYINASYIDVRIM